jgi:hypothetical protein
VTAAESHDRETYGTFEPESWAAAERRYEESGPSAQVVVRAVTKAMGFDREEYDRRVDADVVETARQALFAETLAVQVADRDAFDAWRETYDGSVHVAGSDAVGSVAWHASAPAGTAVAATFEDEPAAAVGTVRRMAFNRLYRDRLTGAEP